jgi:hypothetical protein
MSKKKKWEPEAKQEASSEVAQEEESLLVESPEDSELLLEPVAEIADEPMPQAELEKVIQQEAPIQKFTLSEVCARHVPNWKPQWLPGVSAHARFHGVNEYDTVENIKSAILSYGLSFR